MIQVFVNDLPASHPDSRKCLLRELMEAPYVARPSAGRALSQVVAMLCASVIATSAAFANEAQPRYDVQIRRTSFGIPHIKANDEGSLGYGIGWAYAQDNICLLAGQIVTANGERSKYFGADRKFRNRVTNLRSDTLYRWLDSDGRTESAWKSQPPAVRALLQGYAAGVNRYLADTPAAQRPTACRDAPWLRPISAVDVMRLSRFYTTALGLGGYAETFGIARPGVGASAAPMAAPQARRPEPRRMGSNAVAIGGDFSANGRGMLLGNPHLEWDGPYRLWQLHITIPGKLDVMGASLPGFPGVQIGFNRHVAWSHTVDTAAHYVLYRLKLDPADPTRYVVDGKTHPMKRVEVAVDVAKADGTMVPQTQIVYETEFGPVLAAPGWMPWNREVAYALHDPNQHNDRAFAQWLEMGQANSLREFRKSIETRQGIPWANTIAADDAGTALYIDASVVPYIDARQAEACKLDRRGVESEAPAFMLDGSRAACRPQVDAKSPQPGIYPAALLPALERRDFVQNSNDSAWLANPQQPLVGFSPYVSYSENVQSVRTRYGLHRLTEELRAGRRMDLRRLQGMITDNEAHLANLILDDLISLCNGLTRSSDAEAMSVNAVKGCAALAAWNRTANLDAGPGYLYFSAFVEAIHNMDAVWAVPFDARDPIGTPRGLKLGNAAATAILRSALLQAMKAVEARGLAPGTRWGDLQVAVLGGEKIPIHGGDDALGLYNHIGTSPMEGGLLRVTEGATYLQAVSFERDGPRAEGFLVYSQTMNPDSPHEGDQARRFSTKQWIAFPFTEAQIVSDPEYTTRRLTE